MIVFPSIAGEDLHDEPVRLPDDLDAPATLVLLGFKQRQQREIDTWIVEAAPMEREVEGFRFIEVPMLPPGFALFAGYTANGMRSGIQDPDARARTITVYTDRKAFFREAGLTSGTDTIYALLLDAEGGIVWTAEGAASEAAVADLKSAIADLLG